MYQGPPLPETHLCFCGDTTTLSEVDNAARVRWQVQCDNDLECGARGPMMNEPPQAIAKWNETMPAEKKLNLTALKDAMRFRLARAVTNSSISISLLIDDLLAIVKNSTVHEET